MSHKGRWRNAGKGVIAEKCGSVGHHKRVTVTRKLNIWGSKGFDRGLAAGEAIRCDTLIAWRTMFAILN